MRAAPRRLAARPARSYGTAAVGQSQLLNFHEELLRSRSLSLVLLEAFSLALFCARWIDHCASLRITAHHSAELR